VETTKRSHLINFIRHKFTISVKFIQIYLHQASLDYVFSRLLVSVIQIPSYVPSMLKYIFP